MVALLTGVAASYGNTEVAAFLPTYTGNLIALAGNVITTANIQGNYILGNAAFMTGIPASYGNANVVANLAALGTNPVSTTGNITGGNLITAADVSAASVSASGNVTGGNVNTGEISATAQVVATGNITGGNINTGGLVSSNRQCDWWQHSNCWTNHCHR
jgi:hypothetical protein